MTDIIASITSKGRLTLPAEVRRHLGVKTGDKVAFVIQGEGEVKVSMARYKDINSIAGAAGSLKKPLPWSKVRQIAREDRFSAKACKFYTKYINIFNKKC